ncbi:hypothetical protein LBWT_X4410 (plasmid) [Leptolyngbya boryana IAM M-101]|nr:hypothetical protein LBWT_X4410 [Leptolyngbya boryana IAM M-101]BAS66717.1 hypothetical protein LBDG_X4410 [Leptolyngbya boryana dg5]
MIALTPIDQQFNPVSAQQWITCSHRCLYCWFFSGTTI